MLAQGTDDEYDSETDQGSCVFTLNLKIRKFFRHKNNAYFRLLAAR